MGGEVGEAEGRVGREGKRRGEGREGVRRERRSATSHFTI